MAILVLSPLELGQADLPSEMLPNLFIIKLWKEEC